KASHQAGWATSYLIKRVFRIAPLFWFMMLAYWFLWWWPEYSQERFVEILLLNATFAFNFVPGMHQSVIGAGWSVGVEMPFYLIFPIALIWTRRMWAAVILLSGTMVISIASRLWFTGTYGHMALTSNIAIFVIGLMAYRCFARWRNNAVWKRVGI